MRFKMTTFLSALALSLALTLVMTVPARADTPVPGQTITTNTTWQLAGSPYIIQGNVTVAEAAVLTIEAGVQVRFVAGSTSLDIWGGLVVQGTAGQPVVFTSNQPAPQPGDWGQIYIEPKGHANISHCELNYGGANNWAALDIRSSNVTLQDCTIQNNQKNGIYLNGAGLHPTLENLVIQNNGGDAILQNEPGMQPAYQNLTATGNINNGVVVLCDYGMNAEGTWDGGAAGIPFMPYGWCTVAAGQTLTITAGTTVMPLNAGTLQVNGRLQAQGSADKPIRFTSPKTSPQPGDWTQFYVYASGQVNLSHCQISYAGGSNAAALEIRSSDVTVQNCTIQNNQRHGVYLNGAGLHPVLQALTIQNNGGDAILQNEPGMQPAYQNLAATGNANDGIAVACDYGMNAEGVFDGASAGLPFMPYGWCAVAAGRTLTITAGTTVMPLNAGTFQVNGRLQALGSADKPIRFTSPKNSPQPGDWTQFYVSASGQVNLSHCEISYAGGSNTAALDIRSSDVALQDCTIQNNQKNGIYLNGAGLRPTLENLVIQNNGGDAILQNEPGMQPAYQNLAATGNINNSVVVLCDYGMNANGVFDGASAGLPFMPYGWCTVAAGRTLTITAGTTVMPLNAGTFQVDGRLQAQGSADKPIRFTSPKTSPQPGDWTQFYVSAGGQVNLSHCQISYAGGSNTPALDIRSSNVTLQDCTIQNNQKNGIYLNGAGLHPTLENLVIQNNGGDAILQNEPGMQPAYQNLTATGNINNGVVVLCDYGMNANGVFDGASAGLPFMPYGWCTVAAGRTLTITAGTTVMPLNAGTLQVDGRLQAQGSADKPIRFTSPKASPQPGDWTQFYVYASGQVNLSHCQISYAGGSNAPALEIRSSDVTVQNCAIQNNRRHGIYLNGAGLHPVLQALTIQNNGGDAILQNEPGMQPAYQNLAAAGNANDGIVVACDYGMNAEGVFDGASAGLPFMPYGGCSIPNGRTLTITAGTTAAFLNTGYMNVYGRLVARGTAAQPIIFTSPQALGSASKAAKAPAPGDWERIWIDPNGQAVLDYCQVAYGGKNSVPVVHLGSSNVTVSNCRIHHNGGDGVRLYGAGLYPTLKALRLENNLGSAVVQEEAGMQPVYSGLQASGNTINGIVIWNSGLNRSVTWDSQTAGLPYWVGPLTIPAGQFLTISPGTTVVMVTDTWMTVEGGLYALGTLQQPITVTGASAQPGNWYGIETRATGNTLLSYCDVGYGGRNNSPLLIFNGPGTVENCRIHHSAGDAIRANDAQPMIRYTSIENNLFGVRNWTTAKPVDARNNWWGHASGPAHTTNPSGQGQGVTDGVLFDPWLTSPTQGGSGSGQLIVTVGGPSRFSPGQTVDYAVFYLNQLTQTVNSAVLVVDLPSVSNLVSTSPGGIYWPDRHQVFWRLGNLAPGEWAVLYVRVRYLWGVLEGRQGWARATIGGTNLGPQDFDIQAYLDYAPVLQAAYTPLTEEQVNAERQAYPDFDQLYRYIQSRQPVYSHARRVDWLDGSQTTEVLFIRPGRGESYLLQRSGTEVYAYSFLQDSYALQDTGGGLTMTLSTMGLQFWGGWTPTEPLINRMPLGSEPLPAGVCFRNCMTWNLSSAVLARWSSFTKNALSNKKCQECEKGGWDACYACINDLNFRDEIDPTNAPPDETMTAAVSAMPKQAHNCGKDCKADPTKYGCSKGGIQITCEVINTKLDKAITRPCEKVSGWISTSYAWAEEGKAVKCASGEVCVFNRGCIDFSKMGCKKRPNPKLAGRSLLGPQAPGAIQEDEDSFCAINPTICQIPRDPNEKAGPLSNVLPGQWMTYTVSYENVGQGTAYGVYVTDQLSEYLDGATLSLPSPGTYITASRTIFWDVGELAPKGQPGSGGTFTFTVRLKAGLPSGTVVSNQAVVYFPSVPEETPTNVVVNVVQPLVAVPQTLHTPVVTPKAITLQGEDVSGHSLAYALTSQPGNGQLTGQPPDLTYTPASNFTGEDVFAFTVSNGISESQPATVQIIVDPGPGDTDPPAVSWTDPYSQAVNVPVSSQPVYTEGVTTYYAPFVIVSFSEAMLTSTLTSQAVQLLNAQGQTLPCLLDYDGITHALTLMPGQALQGGSQYTIQVAGTVKDASGNAMGTPYSASFRTAAAAPSGVSLYLPLVKR